MSNEFDEVEASRDELVSGGSRPGVNCVRLHENATAAMVPTMAELIVTYNPYLSSPASKFAYAANEFNQVKASRDGFVSGGSGLGGRPFCC